MTKTLKHSTRTYVEMPVSDRTFEEIKEKLIQAGYDHVLLDNSETLDMNGIALIKENL